MKTIIYSTGCPKCELLKKLLESNNIDFLEFTDVDEMIKQGFDEVPMLKCDDRIFNYAQAVKAIKNGEIK